MATLGGLIGRQHVKYELEWLQEQDGAILVATSSQDDRERRLFTVTNSEYEHVYV